MRHAAILTLIVSGACSGSSSTSVDAALPDAALPDAAPPDAPPPDACPTDCLGVVCGTAKLDCAGVCNGSSVLTGSIDQELTHDMFGYGLKSGAWEVMQFGKSSNLSRVELEIGGALDENFKVTLKLRAGQGPVGTVLREVTYTPTTSSAQGANIEPMLAVTPASVITLEITFTGSDNKSISSAKDYAPAASLPGYPMGKFWYKTYVSDCVKF